MPNTMTLDLSTLQNWAEVLDGSHSLAIVAQALGYLDSDPSTPVAFIKGNEEEPDEPDEPIVMLTVAGASVGGNISVGSASIVKSYFGDIKVKKLYYGPTQIYEATLPKLAAPQNVSVTGVAATFDEVTNAEQYVFFVDGVEIGQCASLWARALEDADAQYVIDGIDEQIYTAEIPAEALRDANGSYVLDHWGLEVSVAPDVVPQVKFAVASQQPTPFTIEMTGVAAPKSWDGTIEYLNNMANQWQVWDGSVISGFWDGIETVLYLRGTGNTTITGGLGGHGDLTYLQIDSTDGVNVSGNSESLLDWQTVKRGGHPPMADGAFAGLFAFQHTLNTDGLILGSLIATETCYALMFKECWGMLTPPVLSATTLAANCYEEMFCNCTGLTIAPELPATTLATSCYYCMFEGCSALVTPPVLPATTLSDGCYQSMFTSCTALTTAPALPATNLTNACYDTMFNGCRSLTVAPTLAADTMAPSCYHAMFTESALSAPPELPATTLAFECYKQMFGGCRSLTSAPALPATTLAEGCYSLMFTGTAIRALPALPATTLAPSCYQSMASQCVLLTATPSLPATTLASWCYAYMFAGCTQLLRAPELPATTLAPSCYYNMFQGCSTLAYAPSLPALNLATQCYAYMFVNCSNLTQLPELPATTIPTGAYQYMFSTCRAIALYDNQVTSSYQAYRLPSSGTTTADSSTVTGMFNQTGGSASMGRNGTPAFHTTYYTTNTIIPAQ